MAGEAANPVDEPLPARTIQLPGGRRLAYGEYGDRRGKPLVYCHGYPACRLEARLGDDAARKLGVRLVAPDRPGYGRSDPVAERTILDWPDDVRALADALGIERFAVLGVSGGAPYAAACAWKIPERITAAGLCCALGPADDAGTAEDLSTLSRFGFFLGRHAPAAAGALLAVAVRAVRHRPEWFVDRLAAAMDPPDRALYEERQLKPLLVTTISEALHQGGAGALRDLELYSRPWGFPLKAIRVPVYCWHGMSDSVVPGAVGRALADRIPGCRTAWYRDEAHFSLPLRYVEEILGALAD